MKFGIDRLRGEPALRKPLAGRRVALLAHPASVTRDLVHSLDVLAALGRLTMVDRDTIHYEVTIEDRTVYTRPWTMAWALVREPDPRFELLEEACVEGDRDLRQRHARPHHDVGGDFRARRVDTQSPA